MKDPGFSPRTTRNTRTKKNLKQDDQDIQDIQDKTKSNSVIYIPLLDEGTDVWRPTEGEEVAELTFRVLPTPNYNPEDEYWAYPPGTLVRCAYKTLSGGKSVLVAVEEV